MSVYYQDDYVTLYHGDCLTDHTEWVSADVLVTDPPYGISWDGTNNYVRGKRHDRKTQGKNNPIHGDADIMTRAAALTAWGKSKPAIVFGSWRRPRPTGVKHRIVWWKQGQQPGPSSAPFIIQDEEIYILGNGWRRKGSALRSVIATQEVRHHAVAQAGHPTPKPIGLMELLIERTPEGVIADPFAGSGATLAAAKNQGRRAIGVEIEERYCEIIARRLSQGVFDFAGPTTSVLPETQEMEF